MYTIIFGSGSLEATLRVAVELGKEGFITVTDTKGGTHRVAVDTREVVAARRVVAAMEVR